MIIVENPTINFIYKDRKDGISAFMRIKNGEDYLKTSILSIIDQVDEIICVFNHSSDNTEKILLDLEEKYPIKIKVYKYIPVVYPPNSKEYLELSDKSVHSLVYYYNFALSKTTYSYCFKFDDDEIFFLNSLLKLKMNIYNNYAIGLRGINLVDIKKKLYLNTNNLFTNGKDTLLFKFNEKCIFIKGDNYEKFSHPFKILKIETIFYHTKNCKKDRGINNYLLSINTNSRYNKITIDWFTNLKLISLEDFLKKHNFINPFELKFNFINDSNKIYNHDTITKLETELNK